VTGNDVRWRHLIGGDAEVTSFDQKSVEGLKVEFWVRLSSYMAVTHRRLPSRDSIDVTGLHVTASDSEVTSFDRKSPGSGCRRLVILVLCTFELSQDLPAGGSRHMTGNDVRWPHVTGSDPEVTSFDWNSPGSGCRRRISRVLGMFELLQSWNSQEVAVTWQEITSRDFTWPEVNRKCGHLTGSNLEVAVGGV